MIVESKFIRWALFFKLIPLRFSGLVMDTALIVFTFVATPPLTYLVIRLERRFGLLARDLHKPMTPLIPSMGGLAIMTVLAIDFLWVLIIGYVRLVAFLAAILIAGFLGLYDDFRDIDARLKVLVFSLPSLPVLLLNAYRPRPYIPLVGELRITILYPILILIAYSVACNALNMADTHNGLAPSATLIILTALGISAFLPGPKPLPHAYILVALLVALLAAYLPFNLYPAKTLNGNVGSFLMGAAITSAAIALRREYLFVLLLVPLGLNGFSILTSIRGVMNRSRIKERPVYLDSDYRMHASLKSDAPVTLVQLLTLSRGLDEKEVVKYYITLLGFSTALSLLTYWLASIA